LSKPHYFNYITGAQLDQLVLQFCKALHGRLREENSQFQFSNWDLNSWMSNRTDMLHYILANVGDRQEMSHSLEGRTPFMDPRVTDVAGRISESSLMRALTEKYTLRKVGAKYLRPENHRRGKKPFFAPMKYLYLKENQKIIQDYIELVKGSLPWLHWRAIDHFLNPKSRATNGALEDSRASLKLTLFSMGVLRQHLREFHIVPRGYALPTETFQLLPFKREF
jgi:hypothetical protein